MCCRSFLIRSSRRRISARGPALVLSIAHTLIENHGGTISAKSEPGNTVFTIELPMARSPKMPHRVEGDAATADAAQASQERSDLAGCWWWTTRSAIVEAICEFLDLQNITTDKANDGEEALKLLAGITAMMRSSATSACPASMGRNFTRRRSQMDPTYANRFLFMSGDLVRDSDPRFCLLAQLSLPGQAVCAAGALPESRAASYRWRRGWGRRPRVGCRPGLSTTKLANGLIGASPTAKTAYLGLNRPPGANGNGHRRHRRPDHAVGRASLRRSVTLGG